MELCPKMLAEPIGSMDYMDNGVLLADENGRIIATRPSSSGEIQPPGWILYYYAEDVARR